MHPGINRAFWLFTFVAGILSLAMLPATSHALTPNWDEATCTEQFAGEFESVWAVKVFPGPPAYVLMSGKIDGAYDIYRSDWDVTDWGSPYKVDSLSSAQPDLDVEIVGFQAYTVVASPGNTIVCDWDEVLGASDCGVQNGGSDDVRSLNYRDGYMYYSGGASGAVRRFDMGVDPWTTHLIGDPDNGVYVANWQSFGAYVGEDFAVISQECDGLRAPPYDCDNAEVSRFHMYSMPGWTVQASPLSNVYDLHPYTKVASPFVAQDGTFWFVGTPDVSPEERHLYSCLPDQNDGYCLGSADSEADCCGAICVGQGCGIHTCGCTPTPDCADRECGEVDNNCGGTFNCGTCTAPEVCLDGQCTCIPKTCDEMTNPCGLVDDGCGTPVDCGTCVNPADYCLDGATRYYYEVAPVCSNGKCQFQTYAEFCEEGCVDGVCQVCTPDCDKKDCGDDGCGGTCGECTGYDTCDDGVCVPHCVHEHPDITGLGTGCEPMEYCGSHPDTDVAVIHNKDGETCTFNIDVKHDGTPAAQVTMTNICWNSVCVRSTLECGESMCALAHGHVNILDNGQGITAVPSGEDVTTGIVGTEYEVMRYTEDSHDIFEAKCTHGHVWYTFFDEITVHLGTCAECREEVKVDLTADLLVEPVDLPEGADEVNADTFDFDVIQNPDVASGDLHRPDSSVAEDDGPGTPDAGTDPGHDSSGGCQGATSAGNGVIPTLLLMSMLGLLVLRRRRTRRKNTTVS